LIGWLVGCHQWSLFLLVTATAHELCCCWVVGGVGLSPSSPSVCLIASVGDCKKFKKMKILTTLRRERKYKGKGAGEGEG